MLSIIIVGVGGQGTLLASKLLGQLALDSGYDVKVSEVHGMAQRGGGVVTHVRMSKDDKVSSPLVELGGADFCLAFEKLEALRALPYIKQGGTLIVNTQEILPLPVIMGTQSYPDAFEERTAHVNTVAVDALAMAKQCANPRGVNVALMGVLAKHLPFAREAWLGAIEKSVPPKTLELNKAAFLKGFEG